MKEKLTKREKIVIGCSIGAVVGVSAFFIAYTENPIKRTICTLKGLPKTSQGVASAFHSITSSFSIGGDVGSIVNNNVVDNSTTFVNVVRQGAPSYIVECIETGEKFMSQNDLAKRLGVSPKIVSDYFAGKNDSIRKMTFRRIGMAIPNDPFDLAA